MALRGTPKVVLQAGVAFAVAAVASALYHRSGSSTRRGKSSSTVDCSKVTPTGGTVAGVRYVERMRGGAKSDERVPMIIVMHSKGGNPTGAASFSGLPKKARVISAQGEHRLGDGYEWVQANSRTDLEGFARDLQVASRRMSTFIDAITRCRPTAGKPVVTGSSQGGHMAYAIASLYPSKIRGAVAVLGYIPPSLWNPGMAPTIGLHTTGDNTVPYPRTVEMWTYLRARGAPLASQSFTGGHQIVPSMSTAWSDNVAGML